MGTAERILEAAERLFAENGIHATSLRRITSEASANLAAVHYHFGSKDALVHEVLARRLRPLNAERLARLDAAERDAGEGAPSLARVVEAFVGPALRLRLEEGGERFPRLMGRLFSESAEVAERVYEDELAHVARRFLGALRRALPGLSEEDLCWRAHWVVGVMAHTLASPQKLRLLSEGRCPAGAETDVEDTLRRMVPFLVAGLRSEAPEDTSRGREIGGGSDAAAEPVAASAPARRRGAP